MDITKKIKSAAEKPYDDSLWEKNIFSMYDNMPYRRDKDLCNQSNLNMESGNIIKYYRCITMEPYEIKN
ncbi:MAG: hypothetical protein GX306_11235 [Clostridiales bacterium]|jgi:hypothetical protein|nr:hypothetical protein [Clostridiales bacterium]